jgi:copper chaperone CopZ
MRIEILYFDGCPNHESAVQLVRDMLTEEGMAAQVDEVKVPDEASARAIGFLGSPSIRVNGLDVEPAARSLSESGMMCRTYMVGGHRQGLPSREMIQAALREAQSGSRGTGPKAREALLLAGSIGAVIVASLCCILPIVFVLTGVSILGASALFAEWRPYLLGLTFGLLGLGFYFAYRQQAEDCAPGSTCSLPAKRRWGRLTLWLSTAAVLLLAAFPYYSEPVANYLLSGNSAGSSQTRPAASLAHATLFIEGMDCGACATAVEKRLKSIAGVRKVAVFLEHQKAEIDYDPGLASLGHMKDAIGESGYRVGKIEERRL